VISSRRLLHQEPPSKYSQTSSDRGRLPSSTTLSTHASSPLSQHQTSHLTATSLRHLLNSSRAAAHADAEHITPQRYFAHSNQLVGGVFLHLTRKLSVISCSHLFSQKLSQACFYGKDAGTSTSGASSLTECMVLLIGCRVAGRLYAALYHRLKVLLHAGGRQPYGVDPSFNSHSSLYRSDSFQRRWQFFNSSANSPELSAAGAPFAFFPRRSRGYNDGFPVFFPVREKHPAISYPCASSPMHA
jgi:hypothetical protein